MSRATEQMTIWSGNFGREYTDRGSHTLGDLSALYKRNYGLTRTKMNQRFLDRIDRSSRILEVGSNIGIQLLNLQKMGFSKLYGLELQNYAIHLSRRLTNNIYTIQGSVFDIPFKDGFFDLVFTSGLLIHIRPAQICMVMKEVHRCTSHYIWGFEYYSENLTETSYRGHNNLLWKADYAKYYLSFFGDLTLIKEEHYKQLESGNFDSMFLLKKEKKGLCE